MHTVRTVQVKGHHQAKQQHDDDEEFLDDFDGPPPPSSDPEYNPPHPHSNHPHLADSSRTLEMSETMTQRQNVHYPDDVSGGVTIAAAAPASSSASPYSLRPAPSTRPPAQSVTTVGGRVSSNGPDTKRYIHLDISGGSNNFGGDGIDSDTGGKGGSLKAKMRHISTLQAIKPTICNQKELLHHFCYNCNNQTSAKEIFANNYISTTKYNLFNFIPKNLFEQFQKKANFYFLLVAIVSLTPLSPKTPVVSVAPLVLVLLVSAIKEAIEDFQRYKMDRRINATKVETWRHSGDTTPTGHGFIQIPWAELLVGDLVLVREGAAFPADIVLLQSAAEQGLAYIETSNLDGETNLKTKQAVPECWRIAVDTVAQQHAAIVQRMSSVGSLGGMQQNGGSAHRLALNPASPSRESNAQTVRDSTGLRWPLKLPPMQIESSAPSRKLDGNAWKGNLTFLGPPKTGAHNMGGLPQLSPHSPALAQQQQLGEFSSEKVALGMSQLLLRGCVLRNTKWIIGIVMFTGVETKLMLNNRPAKLKRSHVDRIVDQSLYILFSIEFVLCSGGALANYFWLSQIGKTLWYLPNSGNIESEAGLSWFTYLVLLDILIPISLYVSMELVKFAQAYLISVDGDMYHAETNTPASARTSNLNEELGQVSYIFSDKTGTLTCNVMNFVACSVGGKVYGLPTANSIGTGGAASGSNGTNGTAAASSSSSSSSDYEPYSIPSLRGVPPRDESFPFRDTSLVRSLLNGQKERTSTYVLIDQFLTLLATCHTVLPDFPGCVKEHIHTYGETCDFDVEYQAASPDEKALTVAAKNNAYYFYHREPMQITVGGGANGVVHPEIAASTAASPHHQQSHIIHAESFSAPSSPRIPQQHQSHLPPIQVNGEKIHVNILGQAHEFLVLDSFEFTSERARMSVILIDPRDGLIKIYTKGSDTKMYKLLSEASRGEDIWEPQDAALKEFSQLGLRTLIAGYKILSEDEYITWAAKYAQAKTCVDEREQRMMECQNEIEQDLTLLGATAIEDRLQDGVPDTIETLSTAGIKIWVLTGDKVITAISIARSCDLVTSKMVEAGLIQLVIDDKATEEQALEATKLLLQSAKEHIERVAPGLKEGESSDTLGIIVSGQALTHIFATPRDARGREILYENLTTKQRADADVLRQQFLDVCTKCRAVVCCRVSPNQKAEVVSLVKNRYKEIITLAIGDGANDVSMIKAAHVGIGISGLEGLQAVMASDYSIAQFRFLKHLLLVHGHWSYERISKLILYSFYKNIAIAMTSIWFAIQSGFSAQLFYDPYAGSVYNIIFTSIPVMLVATLDRDVSKANLLKYPALYESGIKNKSFNVFLLLRIICEGIAHSLVLYYGCVFLFTGAGDVVQDDGQTHDLWVFSTAMYSYLVLVVNMRIALDTSTFTWLNHLFLVLSVLSWFIFILIYCMLQSVTPNMYQVAQWLFNSVTFWLGFGVITAICIVPEVIWLYSNRMFRPTLKDVVMELERGYGPSNTQGEEEHLVLVRATPSPHDSDSAQPAQLVNGASAIHTNGNGNGNSSTHVNGIGGLGPSSHGAANYGTLRDRAITRPPALSVTVTGSNGTPNASAQSASGVTFHTHTTTNAQNEDEMKRSPHTNGLFPPSPTGASSGGGSAHGSSASSGVSGVMLHTASHTPQPPASASLVQTSSSASASHNTHPSSSTASSHSSRPNSLRAAGSRKGTAGDAMVMRRDSEL